MRFKKGNKINLGRVPSKETRLKMREAAIRNNNGKRLNHERGKKSPNWKGGVSRNKHSLSVPGYRQWRSDVFERDKWMCQTCGSKGCYLEAHHIKSWAKFPKLRLDIDNGVTLCRDCHKLTSSYKSKKAL